MEMTNKDLFIEGFLNRISQQFPQSTDAKYNRNLAFEIFSIAVILDKPFEEVFDNIIIRNKEGQNSKKDGGFDGIWFEDLGEYYVMHVFQCKNTPSLKANEIDKFRNDFREIFVQGNKIGRENIDDLSPWIDEYKQISEQGFIIDARLYFTFNGVIKDPNYGKNEQIYETYNSTEPDKMFFRIVDSDEIYNRVSNVTAQKRGDVLFTFRPVKSNISTLDSQGLYTYAIENIRAANFRVPAIEICKLMDEEKKVNGRVELLFEENIRSFLGLKARANKKMDDTINNREDAVYFPFLNNGITIICDQLTIPKSTQDDTYLLPVKNPQIVNGLQTTWVLYQNYKKKQELLNNIFVNVRIYETREKELIAKITDATNTQTPINYRDKISNKNFNSITKTVFANEGINYITKRGEPLSARNLALYKSAVESETVLKFWYATFYEEPETAKNSIATVMQRIFDAATIEKHPLENLFDGSNNSPVYRQLLVAHKIYKFVQEKKQGEQSQLVSYSDELLSYGIYKIVGNNKLADFDSKEVLASAYSKAYRTIENIVYDEIEDHVKTGKQFSYNTYFKKPKCRIDFNKKLGIVEDNSVIEILKTIRG